MIAKSRRRLREIVRHRGGSAAVEFAMIGIPFLVVIFSCLEMFFVFLVSSQLDTATGNLARNVQTGQLQLAGGATAAQLQSEVCGDLGFLGAACSTRLYIDIRTFTSFANVARPNPVVNGTFSPGSLTVNAGNPGDIVLVTAYLQWPLIAPGLDGLFQPLSNGSTVIISSSAFRNEPFEP